MHDISTWKFVFMFFVLSLICPLQSMAELTPLDSEQMAEVNGRHGIGITTEGVRMDTQIDALYYKDADGAYSGDNATYLSLCDVSLRGGIDFHSPVRIGIHTGPNAFSEVPVTSVNVDIDGMTVEVDRFAIDAIRVGDAPGQGPSFGAVEISNMRSVISGKVSIWAH